MKKQLLHTGWCMSQVGDQKQIPATVPGSVYQTLLENNLMENPFWKDNEDKALALMEFDYEFKTTFDMNEDLKAQAVKELVFDGLDTLATITLNGTVVGKAYNMHRVWRFDVTDQLKEVGNELSIVFASPTKFIREENEKLFCDGVEDAMVGFPHLRKAHCMFGWDWGPHLPDAGIWRDTYLEGNSVCKVENFYVTQTHTDSTVSLSIDVEPRLFTDCTPTYKVEVTAPNGTVTTYDETNFTIADPQIWWPNGLGEQPLYTVNVVQLVDGNVIDQCSKRIGLRTLGMNTEKDEYGNKFAHTVNGIDIFAMGADYIPEDNILGRVNYETTYKLLKQCKDANFNSVRVWGGGYYPDDFFFDICDELGLLVWEDFMFACAVYELTEEFEENIKVEIAENIRRIRHHACLGLWCGNNEMEMFVDQNHWVTRISQKADYIKMYEYIIPKLLKEHDPNTFYWPASPSSGGSFDDPNGESRGDVHYWSVWHGNEPFTEYRKFFFRYLSEFGFQAFPSLKTIETFTDDPKDLNVFSYVMEKHQRNGAANGKILNYIQQTYLYPTSLKQVLYASQLLQADAIKYGVEHFRRNRGRCMGAIYWQLNDCWPVTSWASIDYCGRWKALHYYAKRFFSPVMISCQEEGMMTQNKNINDAAFSIKPSAKLNVTNETHFDRNLTVKYSLRKADSSVLMEGSKEITVEKFSSLWLDELFFEDIDIYDTYFFFELLDGSEVISEGSVIFSVPKYFKYEDPNLSCVVDGDTITVTANAYAKSVEILNENEDLILSDNYFDMNKGTKSVKILKGDATGLKLNSIFDIR